MNEIKPIALCLALCLLLTSCLATPYQKLGFSGGFTETQLAPDIFRVRFQGNAFTSGDRAQEFTLLRVSELCFDNGFAHFTIGDESNQVVRQTIQTAPATSRTRSSSYSSTTTYEPAKFHNFFRPNSYMLVRCFKQKPSDRYTFDAAFLIRSLKTKYKIKN